MWMESNLIWRARWKMLRNVGEHLRNLLRCAEIWELSRTWRNKYKKYEARKVCPLVSLSCGITWQTHPQTHTYTYSSRRSASLSFVVRLLSLEVIFTTRAVCLLLRFFATTYLILRHVLRCNASSFYDFFVLFKNPIKPLNFVDTI